MVTLNHCLSFYLVSVSGGAYANCIMSVSDSVHVRFSTLERAIRMWSDANVSYSESNMNRARVPFGQNMPATCTV